MIAAFKRLTNRADLTAETVENLKVFLFAMERLPLITPGVRMRWDDSGDYPSIRPELDPPFSPSNYAMKESAEICTKS